MHISIFIYTHVYTISKDIGINKKKKYDCQTRNPIYMAAKCEMFINWSENVLGNCKKKKRKKEKNNQTWNTKGIIDVKEKMCLTDVKYLRLSA